MLDVFQITHLLSPALSSIRWRRGSQRASAPRRCSLSPRRRSGERVRERGSQRALLVHFDTRTATTPHGLPGDCTRVISFSVARSTTEMSSDGPLAVKRYFPSGEKAIPHGR